MGFAIYARKKFLRELLEVAPGVEPGVLRARLRRRLRDEVVGQRCAHRGGLARIQPVKEHRLRFRQSKGWESFSGILLDPEIPGTGPIGISESDHSCPRLPRHHADRHRPVKRSANAINTMPRPMRITCIALVRGSARRCRPGMSPATAM